MQSRSLIDLMIGAARLDTQVYEDVERDTTQTTNALIVVVIVAICSGIGSAIGAAMSGGTSGGLIGGLVFGVVTSLLGWAVWTACVYWVGTTFLGGTATWGEVMRTVGFAYSPGVLAILSFIPLLGGLIALVVGIWTIVTVVVAIRQSLDVGTGRAIVASILGFIVFIIVAAIVGAIVGVPLSMMGRA